MAALQSIRKRGPLVAVIIGLALLAFLLGDIRKAGSGIFNGSTDIAQVNGKWISYKVYQDKMDELLEVYKLQRGEGGVDENTMQEFRRQIWDQVIKESIMQKEYNELGVAVNPAEVSDMVYGKNVDPTVRQLFTNKETGQFNPSDVVTFLKNMDQDKTGKNKIFWLYMEDQLVTNRYFTKYTNLISKAMYATTEEAKIAANEKNYKVDFNYIQLKYASLSDSSIAISNDELKEYYKAHKENYKQHDSRDIAYVTFDIVASKEDEAAIKNWVGKTQKDFAVSLNDKEFVSSYSDAPFEDKYYKKGELNVRLDSFMFAVNKGEIYGPYIENNAYKLSKLSEIKMLPDSVKARHILLKATQNTTAEKLKAKADSLKDVIQKGGNFEELAKQFSEDAGSASKGGDLGWFKWGAMVKPFNDTCFFGKKGQLIVVNSQFGVHIIEILDKGTEVKKVQVGTIERKIEASQATDQSIYQIASRFAGENNTAEKFESAVTKNKMAKKVAPNLGAGDFALPGLPNAREVIRWAFQTEDKNAISNPVRLENAYVVAQLTEIRETGYATLEQVKSSIEIEVRKEKKATQMMDKLNTEIKKSSNLESIANGLNIKLENATGVTFNSYGLPSAGMEPQVIAVATSIKKNVLSKPIKGLNGVFLLMVTNTVDSEPTKDFSQDKMRLQQSLQGRANYSAYEALKEIAKIKDLRYKFF